MRSCRAPRLSRAAPIGSRSCASILEVARAFSPSNAKTAVTVGDVPCLIGSTAFQACQDKTPEEHCVGTAHIRISLSFPTYLREKVELHSIAAHLIKRVRWHFLRVRQTLCKHQTQALNAQVRSPLRAARPRATAAARSNASGTAVSAHVRMPRVSMSTCAMTTSGATARTTSVSRATGPAVGCATTSETTSRATCAVRVQVCGCGANQQYTRQ